MFLEEINTVKNFIEEKTDNINVDQNFNTESCRKLNDENFTLAQCIKKNKQRNLSNTKVLNRRKNKLDEMIRNTDDFFSEEAIKERDPILYEIYIGVNEKQPEKIKSTSMSSFLMQEIDISLHKENLNNHLRLYQEKYGDYIIDEMFKGGLDKLGKGNNIEDEEDELIRLMHIRFLCGGDKEFFNYSQVDDNEYYDDIKENDHDQEEKFFDNEEPTNNYNSLYTGKQDY